MERQKLLTIDDLAGYVGLSKRTIQNRIYSKKLQIPFIKLPGGAVRFKPSEVEKFLERRTIKPI